MKGELICIFISLICHPFANVSSQGQNSTIATNHVIHKHEGMTSRTGRPSFTGNFSPRHKYALSVIPEDPSDVEIITDSTEKKDTIHSDPYYPNEIDYPNHIDPYDPVPQDPFYPASGSSDLQAFSARRAVSSGSRGSRIRFLDTITQLGRGWHPEISEFICQAPGYFFFTFSNCGQNYAHFRVTLMHNNIGVISSFGDRDGYQMASNGVVLYLKPNDHVYLELAEGLLYEVNTLSGRAYNTFSGFRIL